MIIAVTDRIQCKVPFLEQFRRVAEARPDMMILREKDLPEEEYARLASKCLDMCNTNGIRFCVNSFFRVAEDLSIEYLQIPFEMFVNGIKGKNTIVSIHSAEEAEYAEEMGADALIFGNVFETQCKPGAPSRYEMLKEVCNSVSIPVYGIGGINEKNAHEVREANASGVCMMSEFMLSEDPETLLKNIRENKHPAQRA